MNFFSFAPQPKSLQQVNRRKNASVPPGMLMMPDGSLMSVAQAAGMDMKNAQVGGLSQHHQMLLLQQQQQALAHQLQLQQHAAQHQQNQRAKETVMSVSAERRYFEQVKEVLSTTSRETWQEFVKVLELFSNDAVSKEDMLDLIADLFGPQHNDLFHEFKRLLGSREEYEEHKSDVWYAVPLSEIETRILNAGNHALELEKRHFAVLRQAVSNPNNDPDHGQPGDQRKRAALI
mgnify:CR=1 FL=1